MKGYHNFNDYSQDHPDSGTMRGHTPIFKDEEDNERLQKRKSRSDSFIAPHFRSRWSSRRPGSPPVSKSEIAQNSSGADDVAVDSSKLSEFSGVLELHPKGFGYLRNPNVNLLRLSNDPFVPSNIIEQYQLREGVLVHGAINPDHAGLGPRLVTVRDIDGIVPEGYAHIKPFDTLTPINPKTQIRLETMHDPISTRVIDILSPLGKGHRALIVAPPRTGKTVLLQQICYAVSVNYPSVEIVALFMDERPEEVTDFCRAIRAEVVSSRAEDEIENQIRLAQFVIERCKRLVEMKKDVFLLIDSVTQMAKAFHQWVGRTDRNRTERFNRDAIDVPKKFFSLARHNKEGGSLTVVGTMKVNTGNRIDELIYEEFQGLGNMKFVLDPQLADFCVWPAVNVFESGTRFEETLLPPDALRTVNSLRRAFMRLTHIEAMEYFTNELVRCETNAEFFRKFLQ